MPHLTQVELNMLRELMGPAVTNKDKFEFYSQQATDAQLRGVFQQMAQSCEKKATTFLSFM